jgi:hypothetical protein
MPTKWYERDLDTTPHEVHVRCTTTQSFARQFGGKWPDPVVRIIVDVDARRRSSISAEHLIHLKSTTRSSPRSHRVRLLCLNIGVPGPPASQRRQALGKGNEQGASRRSSGWPIHGFRSPVATSDDTTVERLQRPVVVRVAAVAGEPRDHLMEAGHGGVRDLASGREH